LAVPPSPSSHPDRWKLGPGELPHPVASRHPIGADCPHLHNPHPETRSPFRDRQHQHGPGPEVNRDLLLQEGTFSHSSFARQPGGSGLWKWPTGNRVCYRMAGCRVVVIIDSALTGRSIKSRWSCCRSKAEEPVKGPWSWTLTEIDASLPGRPALVESWGPPR
jgi:hypothetical protein